MALTARQTWEKYKRECNKYSIPRISAVGKVLEGLTTTFKMRNYCPQSIGFWLAFETFENNLQFPVSHIDASNSPFTESACYSLNDLMEASQTLEYLNLSNCRIGFRGIEVMEQGLNYMKCMTELNLSGCDLRDKGGVIVATAFRNNDTCKILNLAHNQLGSDAGRTLGEMLTRNDCLEVLELGWNSLYSEKDCTVPFFNGLKQNTGLRSLGMSWNGITCDPNFVDALRLMCIKNTTLQDIDLENNRLTGYMDDIAIGLRRSKSLLKVKLGGNPLSVEDITMLFNEFKKTVSSMRSISLGKYKWIDKTHAAVLQKVRAKNQQLSIEYAGVMMSIPPKDTDIKVLLMARIRSLAMKPKKAKLRKDMAVFFEKFLTDEIEKCTMDEWLEMCAAFKAKIDVPLCEQIGAEWRDPKTKRVFPMQIAEYYFSMFPRPTPQR